MTNRFDAIVIGAGANGLAAAATLAASGKRVVVLERAPSIGGLQRLIEVAPGFTSPLMCDSAWLPSHVASGLRLDKVAMTPPRVGAALAMTGGGVLSLSVDPPAAQSEIRKYSSRDADRWPKLISRLHRLASFLRSLYSAPAPEVTATSVRDLASLAGLGGRLRTLGRADMTELLRVLPMSIEDFVDDELESDALKAVLAAGAVRDIRQGPKSGGTTFVLLHHLVGAPAGSIRAHAWPSSAPTALIDALAAALKTRGAEIRANVEVARITVKDDAVSGVVLANGDEIAAPIVLSTADPKRTLLELFDTVWLDPEFMRDVSNIRFRGCTAFVHYALDGLPASGLSKDDLASVVSLSPTVQSIERAYDPVKYGERSPTPHIEISMPSLRWPSLAGENKHVLAARVQYVPSNMSDDRALADDVTRAIEQVMPGFTSLVRATRVTTPAALASEYGLSEGSITGGEITLDQILFMRPVPGWARYRMPVQGLYLGGVGCHPGPGIFGGAGWLAARAALA
ncbi:MAG TPA: NAD(P)/FAD-dependent oxidoreductase [Gemmatimonadaceae bacterium]|jgi:phytoene dehydrogenase-like protein